MRYLEGGKPTPDAPRAHKRCLAGTEVQRDQPVQLEFELYFARKSSQWGGGGVAFVRMERIKPAPTLGRAYLLTLPQLIHVAREENAGKVTVSISSEQLAGQPVAVTESGKGWYPILLPCGSLDGIPVVTLTGLPKENARYQNSPSENYLKVVRSGIREIYPNMSDVDLEGYIDKAIERDPIPSSRVRSIIRLCRKWFHRGQELIGSKQRTDFDRPKKSTAP
jgi:hypothetical protein